MVKSKKKTSKPMMKKAELEQIVADFIQAHPTETFTLKRLFSALKLTTHPLKMICVDILNSMLDSNFIVRNYEGEIMYNGHSETMEGIFNRTNGGRCFVDTTDGIGIRIFEEDTLHALPGDKVKVSVFAKRKGSTKLHGQIIEILERCEKPFIGNIRIEGGAAMLMSPNASLPSDIFIPKGKLKKAVNGDKVAVKITDWPENSRNPIGEVVEIFGTSGDNNTEMHAILAEYGLPYKYPEEIEKAADTIEPGITQEEIAQREDFRTVTTFTIDPKDAKDFDDALSIRKISDGLWEVGVHIADVSHYVTEGSIIDKEAQERATSVYLVDRTVPMLPERLCNFICSLRPNEEKLAYSVIFEMNEDAEVRNYRIKHTVIKSDRRFVYDEVQAILEQNGEARDIQGATPVPENNRKGEFCTELIMLNRFAHKLRDNRMKNGAINFDREEVRFDIDDKGKPISVYFKQAKDANKLVEEFMLLANRTVAESIGKVKKPGTTPKTLPYRIHDVPDPGKLDNLGQFVAKFGFILRTQGTKNEIAKSLNKLLSDVKGRSMQELVENVSLRAMMKAKYSTYNIGHYGLAFDYYTHFTSPIRRYPDLMVHRLLTRYANGGKSASQKKYESLCEHSSIMEQLASSAERASIKYKQVEYMADKLGQEFDAIISGVTEFGVYAEIKENKCEGLIPVRFLGEEAFDFDDRNFCLVGRKTHHMFSLGDTIRIKVAKANLYRKTLDFEFIRKISSSTDQSKKFFELIPENKKKGKKKNKRKRK